MARYLVVQEFDVDVFKDQACEVYGINPDDLPFFIWSTTPWQVHNIDPSMVYAFTWDEIPFEQGVKCIFRFVRTAVPVSSGHLNFSS